MKNKELDLLVQPVVEGLGFEFVGLEYMPAGRHSLLRVYIDAPQRGVTVDDCEAVSRQLSAMLDVEEPIHGAYTLEVSSPGLDRPLFTEAHFLRFTGRQGSLRLRVPIDGRRKFVGTLMGVANGVLTIEAEGETVSFPLDHVEKANLVPVIKF